MEKNTNSLYDRNIAIIRKQRPDLFEIIRNYKDSSVDEPSHGPKIEKITTEKGKLNLQVTLGTEEPFMIHDPDDPGKESENFLNIIAASSPGTAILFGMGLGYGALALSQKREKLRHILVYETEIAFFIHAMESIDLSDLICDKRVMLFLGDFPDPKESLAAIAVDLMLEDIFPLKTIGCFKVNQEYNKIEAEVFQFVNTCNMEGNTMRGFGKLFFENRMAHMTSMHKDRRLEELKDRFTGIPAFIISAGPSLDMNVDYLKDALGKSLILSVDSALPILLNKKIIPDFVSSIDYSHLTYEKIADTASRPESRKMKMICSSYVGEAVSRTFPSEEIYWAFNDTALENWMNNLLGGELVVAGTSTVAHLNFIAAFVMGCNPIIFVGQDLAWFGEKSHASYTVLSGGQNAEIMAKENIRVQGINGEELVSSRQFIEYLRFFETWIEKTDRTFINSTARGAAIKGADYQPLEKVISKWCIKNVEKNSFPPRQKINIVEKVDEILKDTKKLENKVQKTGDFGKSVAKQVKTFLGKQREKITGFQMFSPKLQKNINRLDRDYNLYDDDPLWPVFDDLTMEDLKTNEREKQEIDALEGKPMQYAQWLKKSLERTWKVNEIRLKNLRMFQNKIEDLSTYYAREEKLINKIAQTKGTEQEKSIIELCTLYYDTDNLRLLSRFLDNMKYNKMQNEDLPAMVALYYGICALNRFEYHKADTYFDLAVKKDAQLERNIFEERKKLGNWYYNKSIGQFNLGGIDSPSSKIGIHMRLKGLKCCPDHAGLSQEFMDLARKDQNNIQIMLDGSVQQQTANLDKIQSISQAWIDLLESEEFLKNYIPINIASDFYQTRIKAFLDNGVTQKALDMAIHALKLFPGDPNFYISAADASFAMEDFDNGVAYLSRAVELDSSFGIYWKNIGNNLKSSNDYPGAILAYERFLAALPGEINILKEIADCYNQLGETEAAQKVLSLLN